MATEVATVARAATEVARVATAEDRVATVARVATVVDRAATAEDRAVTVVDRVATVVDRVATAARVATVEDRAATAVPRAARPDTTTAPKVVTSPVDRDTEESRVGHNSFVFLPLSPECQVADGQVNKVDTAVSTKTIEMKPSLISLSCFS